MVWIFKHRVTHPCPVTQLTWVNGWGEIVVSDAGSPEVAALVGGLGLLGVVTEVTLQLQPLSFTVVETRSGG